MPDAGTKETWDRSEGRDSPRSPTMVAIPILRLVEGFDRIFQFHALNRQQRECKVVETTLARNIPGKRSRYNHGSSRNLNRRCAGDVARMAPILLWLVMVLCLLISVVKYVMGIILKLSFPSTQIRREVSAICNLANWSINRHLDRAVEAHGEWKKATRCGRMEVSLAISDVRISPAAVVAYNEQELQKK